MSRHHVWYTEKSISKATCNPTTVLVGFTTSTTIEAVRMAYGKAPALSLGYGTLPTTTVRTNAPGSGTHPIRAVLQRTLGQDVETRPACFWVDPLPTKLLPLPRDGRMRSSYRTVWGGNLRFTTPHITKVSAL